MMKRISVFAIMTVAGVAALSLPAYANGAAGVIMYAFCTVGLLIYFLVFSIEALLIQKCLAIGTFKSIAASFLMNIVSTYAGYGTIYVMI